MASLLNNASLLLNPAGSIISYQEDKIYSVLPKDGAGDFTFSGGDGGTRVNQDGYVEITPFNWFNYSNALNTSPWSMNVTGGQTGKDGVANAWLLTKASPTTSDYYTVKPNDGVQTVSFYVKKESSKGIKPYAIGSIALFATINIETGVVISKSGGVDVVVEAYNSSWWRIHVTANVINSFWYWYVTDAAGTQIASTVTLQDMQLVYGNFIKPYQPTTDRLNYPRITYQNGRGALLSEPQRTNVNTYSQAITSSNGYNLGGCSLTGNNAISPDGTQNATLFTETADSNYHRYYKYGTGTASTKVWTIFAKYKPGGREWLTMDAGPLVYFNIANGTLGNTSSDIITKIEPYKDGWYRCTYIDPTSAVDLCFVGAATYNGDPGNYAGDGRDCFWVWGMQCEDGVSFPTSYIPTTSATVTRPADSTNNTNTTNVASVVGQTEGVFYSDLYFEANGAERNYMYLNTNGSYNNGFLYLVGTATNKLGVDIYNFPNTGQFSAQSPVLTTGRYKAAIAYKQNDFAFYLNGVQIATDNSGTVPTLNRMYIGQGSDLGWTNGAPVFTTGFFPTRLTNTQLAELTTIRSGSGGNISYYGPYTIHTFTGSATFTPSFTGPVEVLVVAGGGSAGSAQYHSGGGGAGGLLYVSSYGVTAGSGVTVTIGAGGAAPTTSITRGNNGSNSVFGGLTAIGGGGGGTYTIATGLNGGSGGGGGAQSGVFGAGGLGVIGQGFNGGDYNGGGTANKNGGGGGGAGQIGQTGTDVGTGGNGGNGLPYSISGFSTYYAGGGGGSTEAANLTTAGGLGGGGNGNYDTGQNGVSGLGGGGGAGERYGIVTTGAGGSGIVIVRYLT